MVNQLFAELAALPQVEAVALGGSRAGIHFDEKSDYDVYLYCDAPVPEDLRREILGKYCSYMEIGNQFWETEDNCTLSNGVDIDILYRNLDGFAEGVANVVERHQAYNGYTTCMWHNLLTCKILYDRDGRLAAAKERFSVPYPQQLKENIISRNMKLLTSTLPAYDGQIRKALKRHDQVSICHRTAAFMESYFDILFALNEKTHPGEKRLVTLCLENCPILPGDFEENLDALWHSLFEDPEQVQVNLANIIQNLTKIL